MSLRSVPLVGLLFILAVAVACGVAEPDATPTTVRPASTVSPTNAPSPAATPSHTAESAPTATPTPPTPSPTPTPLVPREWDLQEVQVDGSTVTVSLHVFAGIDVDVTLNGKEADEVNIALPILEFVFVDVAAGEHAILVSDIVGFEETAQVAVPVRPRGTDVVSGRVDEGACIPAGPLGTAVGDIWTLSGPVSTTGDLPSGEVPEDAAALTTTYVVTSIEDANWFVEGADHGSEAVLVKSSVVRTRETNAWLDADGAPIRTKEDERDWSTISMLGLGPVLTLDWDCHGRAWLDGWELPDRPSVEKRTYHRGQRRWSSRSPRCLSFPTRTRTTKYRWSVSTDTTSSPASSS